MSRYADIENAKAVAEHAYHEWNLAMAAADGQREINRCYKMQELCEAVVGVLEHIPTIDIVRCKDCQQLDDIGCCRLNREVDGARREMKPDDFCSYGERKNDG